MSHPDFPRPRQELHEGQWVTVKAERSKFKKARKVRSAVWNEKAGRWEYDVGYLVTLPASQLEKR